MRSLVHKVFEERKHFLRKGALFMACVKTVSMYLQMVITFDFRQTKAMTTLQLDPLKIQPLPKQYINFTLYRGSCSTFGDVLSRVYG